ncbi:PH domain-containing protein [Methanorbis rubei]|uniref:YokE-like PH domain-containing protein n=1 Tax=Methanorbis rubei TaxID=3028300 RepID=A0AAE4SCC1_9EURY|nr:hypothetical protein [Methanocorpusculaceae archaeon Cs1]
MAENEAGGSMPEDILNTFYSGENPLCVLQNLQESGKQRKIIVVTDQRLMYFEENATGLYDDTLFAFARIDTVVYHEGKKVSELKITETDGVMLKVGWLTNEEAQRVILTLQSAMNDLGTAAVSLDRKKSVFSGEEWTLKKPVDYLTKTVKNEAASMKQSYIAPILPKDACEEKEQELFEEEICGAVAADEMDQQTVIECLKALRILYDNCILTEEQYRKYRLPLLEKLDI